jgi:predicted HD phosphohydrolase
MRLLRHFCSKRRMDISLTRAECAHLAKLAHEPPDLVAACLLHDLGHLMSTMPDEFNHTQDDAHQYLSGVFNSAVIDPIRMHVEAKRYLCQAQPGYWDTLSQASKDSLVLQGGPHSEAQAQQFIAQPHCRLSVRLRNELLRLCFAVRPALQHETVF